MGSTLRRRYFALQRNNPAAPAAGLVSRARAGRVVLYRQTETGARLARPEAGQPESAQPEPG